MKVTSLTVASSGQFPHNLQTSSDIDGWGLRQPQPISRSQTEHVCVCECHICAHYALWCSSGVVLTCSSPPVYTLSLSLGVIVWLETGVLESEQIPTSYKSSHKSRPLHILIPATSTLPDRNLCSVSCYHSLLSLLKILLPCCACFPTLHSFVLSLQYLSVSVSCTTSHHQPPCSGLHSPPPPWIPLRTCLPCSTQSTTTSLYTLGFSETHLSYPGSALHISLVQ